MIWNMEQYWRKAQLYAQRALEDGRQVWEHSFWSALALEFLARSALTKIHPVLNADPQDPENLLYAVGIEIKGQPKSIPIHSVLSRLQRVLPTFDKPTKEFCDFFIIVRNRELHTSELAFEGLAEAEWLPRYYKACKSLCEHLGRTLEQLVGTEAGNAAEKLVAALDSDKRAEVVKAIGAHKAVFAAKGEAQRAELKARQEMLAQTWTGAFSGVLCPACGAKAKLSGDLERRTEPMFRDGALVVEETYLATRMDCGACGLILKDIQDIHHAGLDPHFSKVVETDLHAYFEPEYYEEYENM